MIPACLMHQRIQGCQMHRSRRGDFLTEHVHMGLIDAAKAMEMPSSTWLQAMCRVPALCTGIIKGDWGAGLGKGSKLKGKGCPFNYAR